MFKGTYEGAREVSLLKGEDTPSLGPGVKGPLGFPQIPGGDRDLVGSLALPLSSLAALDKHRASLGLSFHICEMGPGMLASSGNRLHRRLNGHGRRAPGTMPGNPWLCPFFFPCPPTPHRGGSSPSYSPRHQYTGQVPHRRTGEDSDTEEDF